MIALEPPTFEAAVVATAGRTVGDGVVKVASAESYSVVVPRSPPSGRLPTWVTTR